MGVSLTSLRILVVDDSDNFRSTMCQSLAEIGFSQVQVASGGAEALQMATAAQTEGNPYSMIFCDWNMPEMSGLDVLKTLRQDSESKSVLVAIVTTESEKTKVLEAITSGANDYIFKPIDTPTLRRKITRLISLLQKS